MSDLPKIPWEGAQKERSLTHKRAGMVVDLRRCTGCHACSISCKTEHDVSLGDFRTRVRYLEKPDRPQLSFLPLLCMHCQDAPCLDVCPTEAIIRLEDGSVSINKAPLQYLWVKLTPFAQTRIRHKVAHKLAIYSDSV